MDDMLTPGEFATTRDVSERTVRRWLRETMLPDAVRIDGKWMIPADAELRPDMRTPVASSSSSSELRVIDPEPVVVDLDEPAVRLSRRFFYTVDDVVALFAPLVSRHAVLEMLRAGELDGLRRGAHGSWLVPAASLRRLIE